MQLFFQIKGRREMVFTTQKIYKFHTQTASVDVSFEIQEVGLYAQGVEIVEGRSVADI